MANELVTEPMRDSEKLPQISQDKDFHDFAVLLSVIIHMFRHCQEIPIDFINKSKHESVVELHKIYKEVRRKSFYNPCIDDLMNLQMTQNQVCMGSSKLIPPEVVIYHVLLMMTKRIRYEILAMYFREAKKKIMEHLCTCPTGEQEIVFQEKTVRLYVYREYGYVFANEGSVFEFLQTTVYELVRNCQKVDTKTIKEIQLLNI